MSKNIVTLKSGSEVTEGHSTVTHQPGRGKVAYYTTPFNQNFHFDLDNDLDLAIRYGSSARLREGITPSTTNRSRVMVDRSLGNFPGFQLSSFGTFLELS